MLHFVGYAISIFYCFYIFHYYFILWNIYKFFIWPKKNKEIFRIFIITKHLQKFALCFLAVLFMLQKWLHENEWNEFCIYIFIHFVANCWKGLFCGFFFNCARLIYDPWFLLLEWRFFYSFHNEVWLSRAWMRWRFLHDEFYILVPGVSIFSIKNGG